jgi:hypothetical protein
MGIERAKALRSVFQSHAPCHAAQLTARAGWNWLER